MKHPVWYDLDRFLDCFEPCPSTGCWLWTGSLDDKGYARRSMLTGGKVRTYPMHRVIMEVVSNRKLAKSEVVRHSCDVPRCINPSHLSVGTYLQNSDDMCSRGRSRPGVERWNARLDPEKVLEIYRSTDRVADVASRFGVTPAAVYDIKRGKNWYHVTGHPRQGQRKSAPGGQRGTLYRQLFPRHCMA